MTVIFLWLTSLVLLLHETQAVSLTLNNDWSLVNGNKSIKLHDISIPSGVYSDLENAGATESVLFSYNDVDLRWIGKENWTYSLKFNATKDEIQHSFVILTFNGLDTLTNISLNGQSVGSTNNMFVRFQFDVKDILIEGENELEIDFASSVEGAKNLNLQREKEIPPDCPPSMYNGECHINLLRKMQASFAWDWGLAAPSMGLWKDVRLEVYDSIFIRDITYQLIDGERTDDDEGDEDFWTIKIFVHMETGLEKAEFNGALSCELVDIQNASLLYKLHIESDESGEYTAELEMKVNKTLVDVWWPNLYGSQSLYDLRIKWEDSQINDVNSRDRKFFIDSKTISVGFRTIELVQTKMKNGLSFYFKVNGVPIFMKGSNWIPSHILPEKTENKERIKELLEAVRDANMNMLRVWGGGVYESSYFYSLADEYGILIWQDMMFACAMYPSDEDFLNSVRVETKQQVRRLQHHASIAIFATNNENEVALRQDWYGTNAHFKEFADDYRKLYVETITDEIKKHAPSHQVLTSSPSNGKYNGDRVFGIGIDPQNPHFGDIHFYIVDHNAWKPEVFHQPRFSSEYGFQSFPSGWKEVLREGNNLTQLIDHRQHHPLKSRPIVFLIEENLKIDFNSLEWDDKIYLSQLSQAMAMKTETEVYRSGRGTFMNTMGALYWQLNDVWVAPSWSSIEYNGNFKMLHHWIQDIFAQHALITQMTILDKLQVYAVSDEIGVEPKAVTVKMNLYRWDNFRVLATREWNYNMTPNAVTLLNEFDLYKYMNENSFDINEYMAEFRLVDDAEGSVLARSYAFPGKFKEVKSVSDSKPEIKISTSKCGNGTHRISLEVKIQKPALFMWIVLNHSEIKKFRLSRNGFMQIEPIQIVEVTFTNPSCLEVVNASNFQFKTLNQFLLSPT